MKKALVLLLILAVAGGAFAQGLTFTGNIWGGLALGFSDVDGDDPRFGLSNGERWGWGARINGAWTNEANTAGARFRITGRHETTNGNGVAEFNWGFAWLRAMDGLLTLYGGKLDQSGFGTGGGVDTHLGMHGGTGLRLDVAPMDGLTIGLAIYDNHNFNRPDPNSNAGALGTTIGNAKYNFAFNYLMPDTIRVIGGFTTTLLGNDAFDAASESYKDMAAKLGFQLLMLRDAGFSTLAIDFGFNNLNDMDKTGSIDIGQRIVYAGIQDVELGLRAMQRIPMVDTNVLGMKFHLWLIYNGMGNIVPRLDAGFNMGNVPGGFDVRGVWDSIGGVADAAEKTMAMVIRPSAQFRVNSSQNFEVGYAGAIDLSDGAGAGGTGSMTHTIFMHMNFAF